MLGIILTDANNQKRDVASEHNVICSQMILSPENVVLHVYYIKSEHQVDSFSEILEKGSMFQFQYHPSNHQLACDELTKDKLGKEIDTLISDIDKLLLYAEKVDVVEANRKNLINGLQLNINNEEKKYSLTNTDNLCIDIYCMQGANEVELKIAKTEVDKAANTQKILYKSAINIADLNIFGQII